MKVTNAVIRLFLKESKKLADGTSPIMLMVAFNGKKKEKATGYSCTAKFWNKRTEEVKKGYPNFVMVNAELNKFKQLAINSRNALIAAGIDYDVKMVVDGMFAEKKEIKALDDVVNEYVNAKCLSSSTKMNWKYLCNIIREFAGEVMLKDIDEQFARSFAIWCTKKGLTDGVVRILLGEINAIWKYGISIGIVDESKYPFRTFNYAAKLKQSNNILYIHRRTMEFMKEWFLDRVIIRENGRWRFRDEVIDDVIEEKGELFPLYLYLLMYMMQGLAPIDIAQIKRSDIQVRTIKGNDYWCIDLKRQKTNKAVPIRIKRHEVYNEVMMGIALMFGNGQFLLPILTNTEASIEIKRNRVNWVFKCSIKALRELWKRINSDIIRHNVESNDNIPQIDLECTYYSARHSYAQNYMEAGGNALALATLLGRSVETIGVYVKNLTHDEDLVDILL